MGFGSFFGRKDSEGFWGPLWRFSEFKLPTSLNSNGHKLRFPLEPRYRRLPNIIGVIPFGIRFTPPVLKIHLYL